MILLDMEICMKKIKLNLGCGVYLMKDFINVDMAYELDEIKSKKGHFVNAVVEPGAKYIKADIRNLPFDDNYADYVEMMEVIEHISFHEVIPTLQEIYRVMKPGAVLKLTCPNLDGVVLDWLRMATLPTFDVDVYIRMAEVVYGNQTAMGEYHHCPFNPKFMHYCMSAVGFSTIKIASFQAGTPASAIPRLEMSKRINQQYMLRYDMLFTEVIK